MKDEIFIARNLRIQRECLDLYFKTQCKEIWMPNVSTGNGFQFNLDTLPCDDRGKRIGILRIDSEEKFDEFFELLQKHSGFETDEDFINSLRPKKIVDDSNQKG